MQQRVTVQDIQNKWSLVNLTPEIDLAQIEIRHAEVNRPALQLAGFFDHFDHERIQLVGNVEYRYMMTLDESLRDERYEQLFSYPFPCLIFCRNLHPTKRAIAAALKRQVPILMTDRVTTDLMAELIRWLKVELAPMIRIHGVLIDVFGEGVLITGESGIGKSETALELIKRGHRLIADDAVDIRKVSDDTLVGSAPSMIKHFIELRGIGIIDVKNLFGVGSVKDTQSINMVIKLEDWDRNKEYDRLGMEERFTEYLGNRVTCYELPVRPGRNLAIIVEAAAMNNRQKRSGYNAAQALYDRFQNNLGKGKK